MAPEEAEPNVPQLTTEEINAKLAELSGLVDQMYDSGMDEKAVKAAIRTNTNLGELFSQYESRAFPKAFQALGKDPTYVSVDDEIGKLVRRTTHQSYKGINDDGFVGKESEYRVAQEFTEALTRSLEMLRPNLVELKSELPTENNLNFSEDQVMRIESVWPEAFTALPVVEGEEEGVEAEGAEAATQEDEEGESYRILPSFFT